MKFNHNKNTHHNNQKYTHLNINYIDSHIHLTNSYIQKSIMQNYIKQKFQIQESSLIQLIKLPFSKKINYQTNKQINEISLNIQLSQYETSKKGNFKLENLNEYKKNTNQYYLSNKLELYAYRLN
ncbi:hypothetical protein ABPG74_020006 [Tetrahymena malaccensis]